MEGFKADYLDIGPQELAEFLLKTSGQYNRDAVNPPDLLECLRLRYLSVDFDLEIPDEVKPEGSQPRALLSFPDRLIAVDRGLRPPRARFSVLHEIGHYVLPTHRHALYLCDAKGMSRWTRLTFEKEANDFAAELLFKGVCFAADAASMNMSVEAVVTLAGKYEASHEAAARRLVEKSLQPVMLVVFKDTAGKAQIDVDSPATWNVRYCVASPTFKDRFFAEITGGVPIDVASEIAVPLRDIRETIQREVVVDITGGKSVCFQAEFFFNQYNIMCLLVPVQ